MAKKKAHDDIATIAEDTPFEAAIAELDGVLERMEGGRLTLDESLSTYRRGAALLRHCQKLLDDADARLRVLEGDALRPLAIDDGSDA